MQVNVCWSSQTGTALDLARQFIQDCNLHHIKVTSAQPLTLPLSLCSGIWILFISTAGQGLLPYSSQSLFKQIMKKSYKMHQKISFAVYALGDSSYGQYFCMGGRKIRQRLRMLGAEEITEIVLADDQDPQGHRQPYLKGWKDTILQYILQKNTNNTNFQVQHNKQNENMAVEGINAAHFASIRERAKQFDAKVVNIDFVSTRKGRQVYWVQLQLPANIPLAEGDIIQILPHNRNQQISYMLSYLNLSQNHIVEYHGHKYTLKQLLTQQMNISSVLNYFFFANNNNKVLAQAVFSKDHAQKLRQFASDYSQYHNFIKLYSRNLVQFIKDFPSKIPLQYLLQSVGQVVGRKYSVARVRDNRAWLLIKLKQQQITAGRLYKGLCTHDLLTALGSSRKIRLHQSQITPSSMRQNNIIVTLGTGLAPFIWMLDRLQGKKVVLVFTNSYSDELFHENKIIFSNQQLQNRKGWQVFAQCTREGGLRMVRLLQSIAEQIQIVLKQINKTRLFICGPRQLYTFVVSFVGKLTGMQQEQVKKSKLIVFESW